MAEPIINHGILKTMLGFLGVKDITAATDSPQAKINITYKQHGRLKELNLTLQQVVAAVQDGDTASAEPLPVDLNEQAGGIT